MTTLKPNIQNNNGEKLDTWVEFSEETIKATVVMVHGFGTNKHETAGYFDDVSVALVNNGYRVVRFDFSGYGRSEGGQEDACYSKHRTDLSCIINYVRANYPEPVHVFAQSMGCFVTALTSPDNIEKTIMTGIPNADINIIVERFVSRFGSRPGSKLDFDGISLLPRSTGEVQKIGPQFWKDIKNLYPLNVIGDFAKKTKLLVVSWNSDEILGKETIDSYDTIKELNHIWLDGDHSVTDPIDREKFIKIMLDYYK